MRIRDGVATGILALSLMATTAEGAIPGKAQLIELAPNLSSPVGAAASNDGTRRLFVHERCGRIKLFTAAGTQLATPFLDLGTTGADRIACGGERGLLGLAFHPNYETNGFFYVFYTRKSDGDLVVARYHVSADPNVADVASETIVLIIEHSSASNHNGGQLMFGANGYLYIGTGDGGGSGDPNENAQNVNTLLGKILRIDVDGDDFPADATRNYRIPPTNPFAGVVAGADEVWAYGLRNPWRFSFDRLNNDLFIGDVGQGLWEEIDYEPAGGSGGMNYGWDCREGAHSYNDTNGDFNANCPPSGLVDPILEYDHNLGCSITGGYVYRNLARAPLYASYLFADYCSSRVWRGVRNGNLWTKEEMFVANGNVTSFAEGESGRLYFTTFTASGGSLWWLAPYSFNDVTPQHWAWSYVEAIYDRSVTLGCLDGANFCPEAPVSRAEMAVFLGRALHGPGFTPPPATGTVFADVPASHWAAAWIEQFFSDGMTSGCALDPRRYCPGQATTRAEMALFLLRLKHGATYTPPPATGTVFADVPASHWAASWIEQLYAEAITSGCATAPLRYCPESTATRAEMAAFITRAKGYTQP